jgi:hypothetical protein
VVAVAGPRKKKSKAGSGWTWRMAGVALCVFFALGVITGLSQSGRVIARRIQALLERLPHGSRSELIPAYQALFFNEPSANVGRSSRTAIVQRMEAIALAEHPDGFYQLDGEGRLSGPLSPADIADLPVLSGNGIESARAPQLVEYAGELIRAETVLAAVISEMRVTSPDEIRIYLDRSHLEIVLMHGDFALELARAARILEVWRGRRQLPGMIDMTVPGEAIVRPRAEIIEHPDRGTFFRAVMPVPLKTLHYEISEAVVSH